MAPPNLDCVLKRFDMLMDLDASDAEADGEEGPPPAGDRLGACPRSPPKTPVSTAPCGSGRGGGRRSTAEDRSAARCCVEGFKEALEREFVRRRLVPCRDLEVCGREGGDHSGLPPEGREEEEEDASPPGAAGTGTSRQDPSERREKRTQEDEEEEKKRRVAAAAAAAAAAVVRGILSGGSGSALRGAPQQRKDGEGEVTAGCFAKVATDGDEEEEKEEEEDDDDEEEEEEEEEGGGVGRRSPCALRTFHLQENEPSVFCHPECRELTAEDAEYPDAFRRLYAKGKERSILSQNGTIRGFKNRVKAGVMFIEEDPVAKVFGEREAGKVVVYVTSLGVVRETYLNCQKVRNILKTLMIRFEERDLFERRDLQLEMTERCGCLKVRIPLVFVEGRLLGDAAVVERLNERGHLRCVLRPYKRWRTSGPCSQCGGLRWLPCLVCHGSRRSDFNSPVPLRCHHCNASGLRVCEGCSDE